MHGAFLSKRPSGIYYIFYNCPKTGKRKSVSTGSRKKNEARDKFAEFIKTYEMDYREIKLHHQTIKYLFEQVLIYVKRNLPRTLPKYKEVLKNFERLTGNKHIKEITPTDIEIYKDYRMAMASKKYPARKISPITVNIEIRTLKAAFNKGVELGIITLNPIARVQKIKVVTDIDESKKRFTPAELEKILNTPYQKRYLMKAVKISRYTGMRLSEVVYLQNKDIDHGTRTITIRSKPVYDYVVKAGSSRVIPIGESLMSELRSWADYSVTADNIHHLYSEQLFVITGTDKYITKGTISREFGKHLKLLGISDKSFHGMRHSFASDLISKGADINVLRELMGHTNIKTTMQYLSSSSEEKYKAINLL